MSKSIERVLMNKESGKLAVGIRLRFMDKYPYEDMGAWGAFNGYKIQLEPTEQDAWAIDNEDGVWIVVANPKIMELIEDLGPLEGNDATQYDLYTG